MYVHMYEYMQRERNKKIKENGKVDDRQVVNARHNGSSHSRYNVTEFAVSRYRLT